MERHGMVRGVWLGQEEKHHGQDGGGNHGEQDKDPGPSEPNHYQASDGGRQQRRDTDDQEDQREDAGALLRREEVANHGNGADLRYATAESLQETKANQDYKAVRVDAAERCRCIKQQSPRERRFAAEAIQQGTVEDLA